MARSGINTQLNPPGITGACVQSKPDHVDLWFPAESLVEETPGALENRDFLWNHYCQNCPILKGCFDWAMAHEEWGIWAGTTEMDRHAARNGGKPLHDLAKRRIARGQKPFQSHVCVGCGSPVPPNRRRCRSCSDATDRTRSEAVLRHYQRRGLPLPLAELHARKVMWEYRARRLELRGPRRSRQSKQNREKALANLREKSARAEEAILNWSRGAK